jgi:uncharacterized membrane protein
LRIIKNCARLKWLVFILISFWYAGLLVPCITGSFAYIKILIPFLKVTYSHVCHQLPQKTMTFNSGGVLVCSRCFGIYTGAFIFSLISLFVNIRLAPKLSILLLFSSPLLIDVIMTTAGVYVYIKLLSFVTGFIFGSVVFVYISNIIFEIYLKEFNKDTF